MNPKWPLYGTMSASRFRGLLMRKLGMIAVAALVTPHTAVMLRAQELIPAKVTVGRNLQTETQIKLSGPAPSEGLLIDVKSDDPSRMLLSKDRFSAGSESIKLNVRGGSIAAPEFYIQGLADSGTATYTISAPGRSSSAGTVTLVPSALVFAGNPIVTVSGAPLSRVALVSAQLDESGQYRTVRQVRGGFSASVKVVSSEPKVGEIANPAVMIAGGESTVNAQFRAAGPGSTTLGLEVPQGFNGTATMLATVNMPGIAITDQQSLGLNLQTNGTVSLGAAAPPGGVTVTMTSSNPERMLLSPSSTEVGSKSISIVIPAGGHTASYYMQGLADSGSATYSASAPGFRDRQATMRLTPSGVVLGAPDPPDEREVLRPELPDPDHGFLVHLSKLKTSPIGIHIVYLEPDSHRGADITRQHLRPGLSLTVNLTSSNPAVGTVPSSLTITGGSAEARGEFKLLSVGSTVLSVSTAPGFTTPTNSQSYKALVVE